ncbi:MAG: class II fructose-bisphosphate aldolase [Patescibacteria group bacterium]
MNLKNYLDQAVENKKAIGHFNVSNWEGIRAVKEISRELNQPIIIGASEGEAEFLGIKEISAIVRHFRQTYNLPLFLNADHFKDLGKIKQAAEAGFDAILFDAVEFDLEENIKKTKQAVELVKSINPDILTEGELGYIGFGSVVREQLPEGAVVSEEQMIKPEQAKRFVQETGVDLIGPGVGNIHGIVKGYKENLSFQRIQEIKDAVPAYLVLHGASGIDNQSIAKAIQAGVSIVHINTELRLAWKNALEKSLEENPKEIAPYKVLLPAVEEIKAVIKEKIAVFNGRE